MKSEQHSLTLITLTSITNYSNFCADSVGNLLQNSLETESIKQFCFAMCVHMNVCVYRHIHAYVCKSEEKFQKAVGSFYPGIKVGKQDLHGHYLLLTVPSHRCGNQLFRMMSI